MTALIVVGGIAVLFLFLLLCPVTFQIRFREEFAARANFLFFRYTIFPRPEKPPKPAEQPKPNAEQPQEPKIRQFLRGKGLSGFLEVLRQAADVSQKTAKRLLTHLTITRFDLDIAVAGPDAAKTAIRYGGVYAAVGSAAGLLFGNVRCTGYRIIVEPDFGGSKSRVRFEGKIRVRLLFLLSAALFALFRSLKIIKRLRSSGGRSQYEQKGGALNGRSSD